MAHLAIPMVILGCAGVALPMFLGRITRKKNDYGLSSSRDLADSDAKANPLLSTPTASVSSSASAALANPAARSGFGTPVPIPSGGVVEPLTAKQKAAMANSRAAEAPIYASDGLWTNAHTARSYMSAMPTVFQSGQMPLGEHMERYRQIARKPAAAKKKKAKAAPRPAAVPAAAAATAAATAPASTSS